MEGPSAQIYPWRPKRADPMGAGSGQVGLHPHLAPIATEKTGTYDGKNRRTDVWDDVAVAACGNCSWGRAALEVSRNP
ncbi:hypothetical protein EPI10_002734 [Gossypium australe]|uniref:Uncharacterized protein n=1 Tax=Gossypium australe TaxID=47621 RepID=A0A5B6VFG9_9ROSI|nr:hypothetical protein EPI10_002734 [Gossypium australe]